MTQTAPVLQAELRERTGKGGARELRRNARIPGIVYGGGQADINVSVNLKEITQLYHTGHFLSEVITLDTGKEKITVLPKDVQLHPVSDAVIHVDFLRLVKGATVSVMVPVRFINKDKSPGLKRGGILNIVRRKVELVCAPDAIPARITVDLEGQKIGSSIHISHINLPEGATPAIRDRDFTIAAIAGRGSKSDADDEATAGADAAKS